MTKTKRQLRAEAVERLKNCVAARFDAESIVIALVSGRRGQSDWSLECNALIDLLTDDEPPEGDALRELRNYANDVRYDYNALDDAYEPDERLAELCEHVADMIERDYVRRDGYDFVVDALKCMKAERDEWQRTAEDYQERKDELTAERDEWKAKAEQAERAMNAAAGKWAKADAELREGSSKVRAGSSNFEWLLEHDRDAIIKAIECTPYSCGECLGKYWEFYESCSGGVREWLMSPHVDDCGQNADMSEKRADCVRNDGFASENDASAEDMGANDAKAELDSREKLEAEIDGTIGDALRNLRKAIYDCVEQGMDVLSFSDGEFIDFEHDEYVGEYVGRAMEAIDRQAAITERELQAQVDDYRAEWHRACAERAELRLDLTSEKNKGIELAEQLGKAMAERDEYRKKVGAMLDAAQEIRRLAEIE